LRKCNFNFNYFNINCFDMKIMLYIEEYNNNAISIS
jgi:hypothetical protein